MKKINEEEEKKIYQDSFKYKYKCPVCEKRILDYEPRKGVGVKRQCPVCESLQRQRLMWLYLKDNTDFFTKKNKILNFSPLKCIRDRCEWMDNLDYTSADIDSNISRVKMDIQNIPYEENTFDGILCNHVLEHVANDIKAMKELRRVLKPNGWAYIQVPIDYDREKTFDAPPSMSKEEREKICGVHHVRRYGLDYLDRLKEAGFKVKVDDYVKKFTEMDLIKYNLEKDEMIYFCRK